jgi:hypothetical protein
MKRIRLVQTFDVPQHADFLDITGWPPTVVAVGVAVELMDEAMNYVVKIYSTAD